VPKGKSRYNKADDEANDGEENPVDWHEGFQVLFVDVEYFIEPMDADGADVDAENGEIAQEEDECFVVSKTKAGSEPRAMVIHF